MGDKKRKATAVSNDIPEKKSKKSKVANDGDVSKTEVTKKVKKSEKKSKDTVVSVDQAVGAPASKKSRKQAADFMSEDEQTPAAQPEESAPNTSANDKAANESSVPSPKKSKKSKKSKKGQTEDLLSADGVNGVVEHAGHEELETATSHKPTSSSMQAEAERTLDHEMEDDFGVGSDGEQAETPVEEIEADDNASALLAGFDSDGEDEDEDTDLDTSSNLKLSKKKSKEVQKKLAQAQKSGNKEGPGTVYVGRIPHGFYEKEMREYFSQFGDITKLRLSRNKHTGASKHFAFIEFSSTEVAKIVAETMDNYLLFGHILKCKYALPDSLHPDTWKGADKKFRKIPHEKLERERLAAPKTEQQWDKKAEREQKKRNKKARQLEALGIELPASKLTNASEALKQQQLEKAEKASLAQIEDAKEAEAGPTGAIKAVNGVPKDEVAIKETKEAEATDESEKKKSKTKGSKKTKATVPEATAEASTAVTEEKAAEPEPAGELEKQKSKSKKSKKTKATIPEAVIETSTGITEEKAAEPEPAIAEAAEEPENKKSKSKKSKKIKTAPDAGAEISEKAADDQAAKEQLAAELESSENAGINPADDFIPLASEEDNEASNSTNAKAAAALSKAKAKATRQAKKKVEKAEKKAKKDHKQAKAGSGGFVRGAAPVTRASSGGA
ncbi:hypothetical protein LTR84_013150 [Exophiala bonariae]|uniref:RRM domain-containing protein n=1 Tax=Exophiala bonariae TaxID=1690606 RepID=A0AAV9NE36_9EURO|nr:hypothetical protein LTR84_013150 [Exophiala bonariae]